MNRYIAMMNYLGPKDELHWIARFQGKKVFCYWRINSVGEDGSRSVTFSMFDKPFYEQMRKCIIVHTIQIEYQTESFKRYCRKTS